MLTDAGSGAAYNRSKGFGAQLRDHIPMGFLCSFSADGALCERIAKVLFLFPAFVIS
jgi:hypothetical protein